MPPYGSLDSPSMSKMEHSRSYGRNGFRLGNIMGDPFALATISISALAWLITFISCIISQVQPIPRDETPFPPFAWWAVVYSFFLIGGIFVVVASDAVRTYHVAITGYLAGGMVLVTSGVNSLVYSKSGAREAAAAGFILLSILVIIWILYFGSAPSATPRAFIDSFALAKDSSAMQGQPMNAYGSGRPETSNSVQPPQMYTSAQLNGFENSSPMGNVSQVNGGRNSTGPVGFGSTTQQHHTKSHDVEVVAPTEYPYQAKAIYSYEANPDDANEITFVKHEILEVSDVSGRWWQARKQNGEIGIAPSNYLILL